MNISRALLHFPRYCNWSINLTQIFKNNSLQIPRHFLRADRYQLVTELCDIKSHVPEKNKQKTALLVFADDAEEILVATVTDIFRRSGVKLTLAGLCDDKPIRCSRDVLIKPDTSLEEAKKKKYDAVILPAGLECSRAMCQSVSLGQYLEQHEKEGRFLAAIGCGPIVLAAHGIAMTQCVTAYPRCEGLENLKRFYKYVDDTPWMEDVQLLTSPGPGTAIDFSLKISEALVGKWKVDEVAKEILKPKHPYKHGSFIV